MDILQRQGVRGGGSGRALIIDYYAYVAARADFAWAFIDTVAGESMIIEGIRRDAQGMR